MTAGTRAPGQSPWTHHVKTVQPFFDAVWKGLKSFELRKNDRDYRVGDSFLQYEWNVETGQPGGRVVYAKIKYILQNETWLQPGVCALGLSLLGQQTIDVKEAQHLLNGPKAPGGAA